MAAMDLVTITNDVSALRDCDIVFEAVSEDVNIKQRVYSIIPRSAAEISLWHLPPTVNFTVLDPLLSASYRCLHVTKSFQTEKKDTGTCWIWPRNIPLPSNPRKLSPAF